MTRTIELLDRLIAFDTVSEKSNLDMVAFIEGFLSERGFRLLRVPSPCGEKAGLIASMGPDCAGVMLSAHSDVVPVAGQSWSCDPFRLTEKDGRLYGRGTTDMKGFLASMLALADRAADKRLKEPLKFAVSYDEEIGCVGISNMTDALSGAFGMPRTCIVGEPTSMKVALGHKGKIAFHAACRGQSGHSALAPRYVNAIHVALDFVSGLRDLQDWYRQNGAEDPEYDVPYSTIHVGRFSAGITTNIVPELAELAFEFRHLPADMPEEAIARIRVSADSAVSRNHDDAHLAPVVDVTQVNSYPGLDVSADTEAARLACSLSGTDLTTKVAFGTEAGILSRLGIPTVVCGPGSMSGQGHEPDEFISKAQLNACDAMMDRILTTLT